jgi:hypothetical protein
MYHLYAILSGFLKKVIPFFELFFTYFKNILHAVGIQLLGIENIF